MTGAGLRAVLWDFGGVIAAGPWDAFAAYERRSGLPAGFIRQLNARNPDDNAWAQLERGEIDRAGFAEQFEAEAVAAGGVLDGLEVLASLTGDIRPQMVEAIRRCHGPLATGLLTNNYPGTGWRDGVGDLLDHFDMVLESATAGVRKPDPRFYLLACAQLEIAPHEAVFLDDLGINLKSARALGMTTIKVIDPDEALAELEEVVGFPLR
jgi:putative hydrolase of the HAD superfamily